MEGQAGQDRYSLSTSLFKLKSRTIRPVHHQLLEAVAI
jgi:hypothetical protein